MGFGIDKKYIQYILRPHLLFIDYKRKKLLNQYSDRSPVFGRYVSILDSQIGKHIYLGKKVSLVKSSIGDHSYVNSSTSIRNTLIGKFCSIGANSLFGMANHPTDFISTHPAFYSNDKTFKTFADKNYFKESDEKIIIGNDVWIGNGVTIKGGVLIGDGAIVAAGSIVTKNVKPYEIVGGIPARHIRNRIEEELIKVIKDSNWWDKDEKWFEENYNLFLDKEKFKKYFKN